MQINQRFTLRFDSDWVIDFSRISQFSHHTMLNVCQQLWSVRPAASAITIDPIENILRHFTLHNKVTFGMWLQHICPFTENKCIWHLILYSGGQKLFWEQYWRSNLDISVPICLQLRHHHGPVQPSFTHGSDVDVDTAVDNALGKLVVAVRYGEVKSSGT